MPTGDSSVADPENEVEMKRIRKLIQYVCVIICMPLVIKSKSESLPNTHAELGIYTSTQTIQTALYVDEPGSKHKLYQFVCSAIFLHTLHTR